MYPKMNCHLQKYFTMSAVWTKLIRLHCVLHIQNYDGDVCYYAYNVSILPHSHQGLTNGIIPVTCHVCAHWHLKPLASRSFVRQLIHVNKRENIKIPLYWPFERGTTETSQLLSKRSGNAESISMSWRQHVLIVVINKNLMILNPI